MPEAEPSVIIEVMRLWVGSKILNVLMAGNSKQVSKNNPCFPSVHGRFIRTPAAE